MKEKYYPNYVDEYRLSGNYIIIKRRCADGVTRPVNTVYYDTPDEAQREFDLL